MTDMQDGGHQQDTTTTQTPPTQPPPPPLQQQPTLPAPQRASTLSTSPVRTFTIPRNKSTGSLRVSHSTATGLTPGPPPGREGSMDSAASLDGPFSSQSPIDYEYERGGFASSGLSRIRQQPIFARASYGGSGAAGYRSSSMTLQIPPSPSALKAGPSIPASPLLTVTEDLTRFPFESLHSFSFAHKPDDLMQTRSNILKRSMDFMKDRLGWAAGGLSVVSAQAKLSGDQSAQSMMELLSKANLLGNEKGLGLVTGPATVSQDNVFEKVFQAHTMESPTEVEIPSPLPQDAPAGQDEAEPKGLGLSRATTQPLPRFSLGSSPGSPDEEEEEGGGGGGEDEDDVITPTVMPVPNDRPALKRTFTDIATVSLQNKLSDALGQPYLADDSSTISPTNTSFLPGPQSVTSTSTFPSSVPHAHGREVPTSQAIFTTEAKPPWAISAANDLACLVFGLSRAEIRKVGLLDMIAEDRRAWLENKLLTSTQALKSSQQAPPAPTPPKPEPPKITSILGNGVTARLLSKPSSRETGKGQRTNRSPPVDSSSSSASSQIKVGDWRTGTQSTASSSSAATNPDDAGKSKGVLLCGDVVSILKRNGTVGSATLWVQEKRGSLIWVMEEIAEDVAYLTVDEIGSVIKVSGQSEAVWGMERVRRGMDITRLLPGIPRIIGTNTGALDYDQIAALRRFTARTANDISIPVTVDRLSGQTTFRISSFPHIAGMIVLSASTLKVTSSNSVVCEALFGRSLDGLPLTEVIPGFDNILNILVEEDHVKLVEGLVIPEHSFRRARAMLAIKEGRAEAASIFLRPSGLPAVHRDGAEIMIDVQMRIMRNETYNKKYSENVVEEAAATEIFPGELRPPQIVYAIWVTYSRTLHAAHHGTGPVTPIISRPATPPQQPSPSQVVTVHDSDSEDSRSHSKNSSVSETSTTKTRQSFDSTPSKAESPADSPNTAIAKAHKKSISDYVILEDMGAGAYGQVKLARPKADPSKKVVIKYVTKRRILVDTWTRDRRLGTVPLEIHVLDYLRRDGFKHPNIVEMSGFFEDDINYYIEMVPHGLPGMDLFDYIELRVNMEEEECRRIFFQVASAIEFLHLKAKVVHRDIKDENVILDGEGNIKLIDFGSASYIKNGPFNVFVGTIDYAAPEVLAGKEYRGPEQDVWALGILLYTILYKENPFYSIDEIMDHDLRVPYVVSEASIALVRLMLDRDVEARIDIKGIVADDWCHGTDT